MIQAANTPTYKELTILISPGPDGKFLVRASSDQGDEDGELELPVTAAQLPALMRSLSRSVVSSEMSRDGQSESESTVEVIHPREFGVRLYKALFRDEVRSLLDRTIGSIEDKVNGGVRIRLQFASVRDDMSHVVSLPWELVDKSISPYDQPLVASRRFPLVRHLTSDKPTSPPAQLQTLFRVLVVVSSPSGHAALDLASEEAKLRKTWGELRGIELVVVRGVLDELRALLLKEDFHVLHFMGHGDFRNGRGVLLMETSDGKSDPVDGAVLAKLLTDEKSLRLVFLNACRTAATDIQSGSDPFAGVATALVRAGVTAVLAMQFPISDRAALVFSRTFYEALVNGMPVDAAVGAARNDIFTPGQQHAEWGTPVLFLRSSDGVLFDRQYVTPMAAVPEAPAPTMDGAVATVLDVAAQTASTPSGAVATTESAPNGTDVFTVAMASTRSALSSLRQRTISELQAKGITVREAVPAPMVEHEASIRELAATSDLFVHLLDAKPGEAMDDAPDERSYQMEQFRIANEVSDTQLVVLPSGLSLDAVANDGYKQFLQAMESRHRTEQFTLAKIDNDAIVAEILGKRDAILAQRRQPAVSKVYLDAHMRDFVAAVPLQMLLAELGVTALTMPAGDKPPREAIEAFAKNVQQVPLVMVVAGTVSETWLLERLKVAMRAGLDCTPEPRLVVVRLPGSVPLTGMPIWASVIGDGVSMPTAAELQQMMKSVAEGFR